jgi:hypothetical protein
MVRNHNQKSKDMAESVLPSTRRRAVRNDRRTIHQRHRARTRAALTAYRQAVDPVDVEVNAREMPDRALRDFVWERRAADKVGPLVRWAIRRVERDPQLRDADVATQVDAFRGILPDNLIGRHALSHIEWGLSWHSRKHLYRAIGSPRADRERELLRNRVQLILETGRHADLNAGIRALAAEWPLAGSAQAVASDRVPHRMLRGAHDLDAFIEDVAGVERIIELVTRLSE